MKKQKKTKAFITTMSFNKICLSEPRMRGEEPLCNITGVRTGRFFAALRMTIVMNILLFFLVLSIAEGQTNNETPKTYHFTIEGMTCDGCANTITQALLKVDGIASATVDFETKKAKVVASDKITRKQIKQVIASKNFEALFSGESLVKPLTDEEKSTLNISVIKGGKKIKIKEHLTAGKITIFDFYADWCAPCRVFSPKVERLLLKYSTVNLKKVDIVTWKSDLSKQLTKEYQLPALPFVLIFDDKGKLLGKIEGNYIEKVEEIIKQNLK